MSHFDENAWSMSSVDPQHHFIFKDPKTVLSFNVGNPDQDSFGLSDPVSNQLFDMKKSMG
jgi:hypothetical protein